MRVRIQSTQQFVVAQGLSSHVSILSRKIGGLSLLNITFNRTRAEDKEMARINFDKLDDAVMRT